VAGLFSAGSPSVRPSGRRSRRSTGAPARTSVSLARRERSQHRRDHHGLRGVEVAEDRCRADGLEPFRVDAHVTIVGALPSAAKDAGAVALLDPEQLSVVQSREPTSPAAAIRGTRGDAMPAADTREPIPAGLEISYEPRRPEFDPTLNVEVEVDWTGRPRNRLVAIGDSITQGFMSGSIFRTDLSWPAIVAFELGDFRSFRRPVYEPPSGPGGIPLDIERALRSFEARFGSKADWHEYVRIASWLHGYLDRIEDYWERGDGTKAPPADRILHNLAIYGWDLRDTLSLTATRVRSRIGRARDDVWLPRQMVEDNNDRAALFVLETARRGNRRLTPLGAARVLGEEGTDVSGAGPGIETLVVVLGSNNALQAVTRLEVAWSGAGYDDFARKGAYTVWRPEHFAAEWRLLVAELRRVRARHVIVATVPAVTIAPIARGVRGKVQLGSRYFPYYTRPWVRDEDFDPDSDPHITEDEARAVDSAIDAYNRTIIDSVAAARQDGLDWYLFDLGGFLDRLASKRYLSDPAARPDWWTPYELPPELARLDPVPNTRFFASGPGGRTDGGLFSLDGIHPTTIANGVIADEVMRIMNQARVEFRTPSGDPRPAPARVDFARVLASDTLINRPPTSLSGNLATLGWLDDRLDWVRTLF
jgi:hypothetical protein